MIEFIGFFVFENRYFFELIINIFYCKFIIEELFDYMFMSLFKIFVVK